MIFRAKEVVMIIRERNLAFPEKIKINKYLQQILKRKNVTQTLKHTNKATNTNII
jgi:hypothetical protein